MTELQSVMAAARTLGPPSSSQSPLLLATVVAIKGSSYRRPGARLLLAGDRWITGSVSGGCLEGDLVRRGWWHTGTAHAAVVSYDSTSDEEDPGWGIGFGCNGVVDVLLERLEATQAAAACLFEVAERPRVCALVTVFQSPVPELPVGGRLVVERDGRLTAALSNDGAEPPRGLSLEAVRIIESLVQAGKNLFDRGTPARPFASTIIVGSGTSTVHALLELVVPPPSLFVCGGGRDAAPLVTLARLVGWDVSVYEPRRREFLAARFKDAHRVISGDLRTLRQAIDAVPGALAVVMSHDFQLDSQLLRTLAPSSARYIGVLGPRRRTEKLLSTLSAEGVELPPDLRRRLFSPIGLAVGAETPEEIALAIVAEAQAVLAGETAGFLRGRAGAIHAAQEGDASQFTSALEAAE